MKTRRRPGGPEKDSRRLQMDPKWLPGNLKFESFDLKVETCTKDKLLSTHWDPKGLPNDSPGPTSGADRKFWIRIRLCVNDDWPMCLYDSEPSPLPIRPTSKQNSEIRKLEISKTRKLENAKPCKLENSTTRTPDNSTTRKLEISTTRELENAKPQKLLKKRKTRKLDNSTT